MDKFTTHTGVAMPLPRNDVDTDQIIPASFMKRITKSGYDDALFHSWRQRPDFILNQPPYASASILVAGSNFGIGSSREHAVWALRDYGFRAVLSPRFADIFRGNAGKQGLLTAQVDEDVATNLWAFLDAAPGAEITVDLTSKTVAWAVGEASFAIDDYTQQRLIEGLDEIDVTLANATAIDEFERQRPTWLPVTTLRLPARTDK